MKLPNRLCDLNHPSAIVAVVIRNFYVRILQSSSPNRGVQSRRRQSELALKSLNDSKSLNASSIDTSLTPTPSGTE